MSPLEDVARDGGAPPIECPSRLASPQWHGGRPHCDVCDAPVFAYYTSQTMVLVDLWTIPAHPVFDLQALAAALL